MQTTKSNKRRIWIVAALAGVCLWLAAGPAEAAAKQMQITFGGYTNRSEVLTNFPVLVVLSNGVGSGFTFDDFVTTNGADLRFYTTSDGTGDGLNYEIESWNTNAGQACYVWVQVPTIPSNGTGSIYSKWGDSAHSSQPPCTTNGAVWTNGYAGVWHLGEASGTNWDSTANRNHGARYNNTVTNGQVGSAQYFDGSTAYINVADANSLDHARITAEVWFKTSTADGVYRRILDKAFSGGYAVCMWGDSSGKAGSAINNQQPFPASTGSVADGKWHHAVLTYNGSVQRFFVDGKQHGELSWSGSITANAYPLAIGCNQSTGPNGEWFNGMLDEARVSSEDRGSNWVWACYLNQASNTVFNNYGAAQSANADLPVVANGIAMNITASSAALSGTLTTNGTSAATVYLFCATNDCTTNEASWIAAGTVVTNFGPYSTGAAFTNTATGLASNTWYWWNHMASNTSGKGWAATAGSPSFKTLGPPAVNNTNGATNVGASTATLNGNLDNGAPADVYIYYWVTGAGSSNVLSVGSRGLGAFSTNVNGLLPSTAYSYQCFASNAYGTAWAPAASNFTTLASVVTNGNVTWTNGPGAPYWDIPANWTGGRVPTNPTAGKVIYDVYGQAMVGKLETDRTIGGIVLGVGWNAWSAGQSHTLDLNSYRLTIAGHLQFDTAGDAAATRYLTFTNGTVQIGTDSVEGDLQLYGLYGGDCAVTFKPGTTIDSYRMGTLRIGSGHQGSNRRGSWVDLRGAAVAGGVLKVKNLYMTTKSGYNVGLMFDGMTTLNTLSVTNELDVGDSAYNGGTVYFGNPADFKLPPNVNVQVGTSPSVRGARLRIGKGATTATLTASSGGWFKAYVTDLTIGDPAYNGTLDIRAMTNCTIDAVTFTVCKESGSPAATPQAVARLCPGTVTAGTVTLGSTVSGGYGLLELSNTLFTVTNSYTINTTATNLISLGATPIGLDVTGTFIDGGGRIRVTFLEAPTVATNWAIRIAGNAQSALNGMIGASPSRLTYTGAYAGKKAGVLYDGTYTYFALADSNAFSTLPIAVAYDERTYEVAPGYPVTVATNDINNGSSDPESRPMTMTIYTNGGAESASLTFDATNDYGVTLKVTAGPDSATDTCTVHVVSVHPGVAGNLTWKGGAPTALMDRREWMWSGNWLEGTPPTNPTPATIYYKTLGQTVTGILEQARTIGGLYFDSGANGTTIAHTLDLGGNTLTLAGALNGEYYRSWSMRMTNGTLRLGSASQAASLGVGRMGAATLTLSPGMNLDPVNVSSIYLGEYNSSGSGQALLDLRGCTIVGGVLRMANLTLSGYTAQSAFLYLDGNTAISSINVSNNLTFGDTGGGGMIYMGNPVDGKLPPNVSVSVGVSPSQRGNLVLSRCSNNPNVRTNKLVASSGGNFSAFLSTLCLSANHAVNSTTAQYGLLDISQMNSCAIDVQSLLLAPDHATTPLATDQYQGELRLCPGTALVATAVIGGSVNAGFGRLVLSNTTFTVTNSITINKTGQMTVNVGSQPSGLVISNAANSALSLATATNGALRIVFRAKPAASPFYGLAWAGDHVTAVQGLQADGKLVVDSTGLAPKAAEIFKSGGFTYVGVPLPGGTSFVFR